MVELMDLRSESENIAANAQHRDEDCMVKSVISDKSEKESEDTDSQSVECQSPPMSKGEEEVRKDDAVVMEGVISSVGTESFSLQGSWIFNGVVMGKFGYRSGPEDVQYASEGPSLDSSELDLRLHDLRRWAGSFSMVNPSFDMKKKKKGNTRKFLTVVERFECTLEEGDETKEEQTSCCKLVGYGRNRFGRFKLQATLDRTSGELKGVKQYLPKCQSAADSPPSSWTSSSSTTSSSGKSRKLCQGEAVRSSKRQRIPNRLLMLDTSQTNYAFLARHGNGSALTPNELAYAKGTKNKRALLSPTEDTSNNMRDVEKVMMRPIDKDKACSFRKTARRKTVSLVRQLLREQAEIRRIKQSGGILPIVSPPSDVKTQEEVPDLTSTRGQLYQGGLFEGMRHGFGVIALENGTVYEGEWQFGQMHGKGMLFNSSGQLLYQGEFFDGIICGRGTHLWEDGSRFDGEFRDSLPHGYGVLFDGDSGTTYSGEWSRGKRSGHGTIVLEDGSLYDGEWSENLFHGKGIYQVKGGISYDGTFKANQFEGRGVCKYATQDCFEGTFKKGLKEGRGTYTFANGAVYEGRFRQDALEGFGTLKLNNEQTLQISDQDWFIPVSVKSEIKYVHRAAGFSEDGL